MNKTTLINIINEEFVGEVKYKNGVSKVFKNPTSKDIQDFLTSQMNSDMPRDVRFIIDAKKKNVYIFSYNALHHTVATKVGITDYNAEPVSDENQNFRFFTGIARVNGSSLKIIESDVIDNADYRNISPRTLTNFLKIDWSFAQKYFDTDLKRYIRMAVDKR